MNRWMSVISRRKVLVFLLLAWCGGFTGPRKAECYVAA
jgi:hypothetical protein